MFGAIYGDIIGSYYEVHCTKEYDFLFQKDSTFTDDSVLNTATAKAILLNPKPITKRQLNQRSREYAIQYQQYYSWFPHAGYGNLFISWASSHSTRKQRSYGNGGAMRVVPIGWAYDDMEQVLLQAKASCICTHNHPEAIKGRRRWLVRLFLARMELIKTKSVWSCQSVFIIRLHSGLMTFALFTNLTAEQITAFLLQLSAFWNRQTLKAQSGTLFHWVVMQIPWLVSLEELQKHIIRKYRILCENSVI